MFIANSEAIDEIYFELFDDVAPHQADAQELKYSDRVTMVCAAKILFELRKIKKKVYAQADGVITPDDPVDWNIYWDRKIEGATDEELNVLQRLLDQRRITSVYYH